MAMRTRKQLYRTENYMPESREKHIENLERTFWRRGDLYVAGILNRLVRELHMT